ncbi:hypothetical protein NDU88_008799 [Pleurodeles waltl]|uniref:Uncharacterized protein n=1 Tax=Pleurodeles waltl TaxID=8319 RepID=A0AAV7QR07_PLEWA|nr:hypothetical protein NDU88_008799 [Pleurodeles waltl]
MARLDASAKASTSSSDTFERLGLAFFKSLLDARESWVTTQPVFNPEDNSCSPRGSDDNAGEDSDNPNGDSGDEPGTSRPWSPEDGTKRDRQDDDDEKDS